VPYRWRWAALFVILAADVMDLLDALVTTVAGPTIRAGLGGSDTLIQWLGAGYTLAMGVGLLTGGRLGDIYGRKRMFLVGAAGFVAASAICALSSTPGVLVAARVVQGLFGALLMPQGLALVKDMFPPQEMGKAFGAFGPVLGLCSVGGPILAGWLVHFGWQTIFLINIPIGVLAILAGYLLLPSARSTPVRWDLPGVAMFSVGAFLLIYPLVQGREFGWPGWVFAMMAASIVVFGLFARYEQRRSDPLIVPSLFRKRAFTGGLVAGLAFFSAIVGFGLVFNLYVQLVLGYTPLRAGLAGAPQALGMVLGFLAANALLDRYGRRLMHAGLAVIALGLLAFGATVSLAGAHVSPAQLAPALTVIGLGMGPLIAPFFTIVLAGVESHETGSASGALTSIQLLGGALGIAVLGTVFFSAGSMRPVIAVELGLLLLTFVATFALPRTADHSMAIEEPAQENA
jgi:EmrB/QacA subfamily drug resistance transporter